jgi:hypothetical protein
MRAQVALAVLAAGLLSCTGAFADYIEIRRTATIYAEPSRTSDVIDTVGPTAENPLVILYLDEGQPRERGYLRVYVPSAGEYGFVYKTAGRVFRDHKGKYKPYERTAYRHWIDEDRNCLDTRQEVLLRDDSSGRAKVEKVGSRCVVVGGAWSDPYTGETISSAKAIDVDHLVPLKNAHESGGWAWPAERKKAYANYLGNAYHLLAASASENRRKGDKGPDEYLPPNERARCDYVRNFAGVKRAWGLRVTASEMAAMQTVLEACPGQ